MNGSESGFTSFRSGDLRMPGPRRGRSVNTVPPVAGPVAGPVASPISRPISARPQPVSRRSFLAGAGTLAGLASLGGLPRAWGAPAVDSPAEQRVAQLYQSLSAAQKTQIALPFDHDLRTRISANWHVTKPKLGDDFYTPDQRQLVQDIVRGVTSPEGFELLEKQTEFDDGGWDGYSIALFGTPGSGQFEWELTGRHLTLRADGNSVPKAAFGGPLVYGHGEESPKKNLFYPQTVKVNQLLAALDPAQAAMATLDKAPAESAVALRGRDGQFAGLPVAKLSADQRQLVEQTLRFLLAPYRQADVDEVFEVLRANGGVESLHLAFYREGDLLEDRQWDMWRVEGPGFVWHFRGAPHVHAYINIAALA